MAVLTGRSGQLFVDGTRVARCTGWSLDEQRPMLDVTPVDSWDAEVIPGRREATGTAKLLYDPTDAAALDLFDSILLDGVSEKPITLLLDSATDLGYPVNVHVSSASHAVNRGEAQMRDISFRVSDVGIELEIVGNSRASQGITQLYTGAVFGLDGAWSFLWTASGPTIADPTAQSTNITFPATGTFTITLTATLGLTTLTATKTVEVIETPLMWVSRPNYLMADVGWQLPGVCHFNTVSKEVYHITPTWPDSVSPTQTILSKFNYAGDKLATKKITGLGTNPGVSDYHTPTALQIVDGGDLFLAFNKFNQLQIMLLSADLSTIAWQQRYTGINIAGATYDASANRIIFFQQGGSAGTSLFGTIEMSDGALARFRANNSANLFPSRLCLTEAGKIVHASCVDSSIILIECNNDLRVGGNPGPVKTVEHQFASTIANSGCAVLETDNYIAVVASATSTISLFSKTDFSHVKTRFLSAGNILNAFYAGGEFCVTIGNSPGWRMYKISEDLTADTAMVTIGVSGVNPPVITIAERIAQTVADCGNNWDSDLSLVALHLRQRNTARTLAEMIVFCRASYGANNSLNYGPHDLTITTATPTGLGTSLLTPTASLDRSYTFVTASSTTTTGTVSIADDTNPYLSYVLTE